MSGCERIVIAQSAEQDLEAGYWFYESQLAGLGDYFLDSLSSDIDALRLFAGVHAQPFGRHVFRSLARSFPYAIYYTLEDRVARVIAVLDCRRDPQVAQKRLS